MLVNGIQHIGVSTRVRGKTRDRAIAAARRKVVDGQLYLISRHGGWFRPEAHGYTNQIGHAGLFSAETARGYLDVEGLSVCMLSTAASAIDRDIAECETRIVALRNMKTHLSL